MNSNADMFIYTNLKPVSAFNERTSLCIYEPSHRLFVVKKLDSSLRSVYEALGAVESDRLAKIYCLADTDNGIEAMCEYVQGEPLSDLLRKNRTLPPEKASRIAADVCEGLSALHRAGFVHRDINPNNIIITRDGGAVIIDFGIARSFTGEKSADTVILGTPGYAAPEQFGFSQSDAKTDIYAVGVLLNVMLTGALPNEKAATGALGRVISKCVRVDSKRRYRTIDSLKDDLRDGSSERGRADTFLSLIPGLRSRHAVVVIISAILYFLAVILSILFFATIKEGRFFGSFTGWLLFMPVPLICFGNFLNLRNILPFARNSSKRAQKIIYSIIGTVSLLVGIFLIGYSAS